VSHLVGLDIGQRDDFTALAVVEEETDTRALTLVALERIRHRPYPEIAQLVADTMADLPDAALLVDCTGVGRPVTDQLTALRVRHVRINIHGGSAVSVLDDGTLSVPKRDLIAALVVAFESGRLKIAAGLPHAEALEREAAAFTMKINASGHDTYNAREGEHDDLLLAVSLPVWHAGRRPPAAASAEVPTSPGGYHADRGAVLAGYGRRRSLI
jgi:hypothetical protein